MLWYGWFGDEYGMFLLSFSMVWYGLDGFWYPLLNDVIDLVYCLRPMPVER